MHLLVSFLKHTSRLIPCFLGPSIQAAQAGRGQEKSRARRCERGKPFFRIFSFNPQTNNYTLQEREKIALQSRREETERLRLQAALKKVDKIAENEKIAEQRIKEQLDKLDEEKAKVEGQKKLVFALRLAQAVGDFEKCI